MMKPAHCTCLETGMKIQMPTSRCN